MNASTEFSQLCTKSKSASTIQGRLLRTIAVRAGCSPRKSPRSSTQTTKPSSLIQKNKTCKPCEFVKGCLMLWGVDFFLPKEWTYSTIRCFYREVIAIRTIFKDYSFSVKDLTIRWWFCKGLFNTHLHHSFMQCSEFANLYPPAREIPTDPQCSIPDLYLMVPDGAATVPLIFGSLPMGVRFGTMKQEEIFTLWFNELRKTNIPLERRDCVEADIPRHVSPGLCHLPSAGVWLVYRLQLEY